MSEDRCVCCGEIVPEGRMVCPICEKQKPMRNLSHGEMVQIAEGRRKPMAKRYYDYETLCDGMHDVVLKNGALHRCIDAGMILELPQADVVEVKHGKWIEKRNGHFKTDVPRCSLCSNASPFKYNYCPTCGADMGRKEDAKIH